MARRFTGPLTRYGMAFGVLCGAVVPAWGATDGTASRPAISGHVPTSADTVDLLDFDIPAQSLDAALYRFGDLSHQPALFPSAMIAGLASSPVHGRYSAQAALRLLLDGTGLVAEKMASAHGDVFLLKKAGSGTGSTPAADVGLDGYPALIQTRVMQALCADARIAPGSYRSLFRVQVDEVGGIEDARLIDSTGDRRRDAALLATLRQVQVGVPPPSVAMRQPFTMALSPIGPGTGSPCGAEALGQRP